MQQISHQEQQDNAKPIAVGLEASGHEVTTAAGDRIDILIQSDTHLIAIENKIYHSVINPFHDYASFLQQQRGNRKLIMFLLSLYPVKNPDLHGFIPIQYSDFFSKLRPLMGDHITKANTKFLISLTDFIETIENLIRGSAMDESMVNLFHERGSDIVALDIWIKASCLFFSDRCFGFTNLQMPLVTDVISIRMFVKSQS